MFAIYKNGQIIAIVQIAISENGQIIAILQIAIYKNGQIIAILQIASYKNGQIIAILQIIKIPSIGNFCNLYKRPNYCNNININGFYFRIYNHDPCLHIPD
jgi:hypothetical protein